MARREITLALAGAGLLAAFFLAKRARAAEVLQTYNLDTGELVAGEDYAGASYSLDELQTANEPGIFSDILTMTQTDPRTALANPNVQAFLAMIGQFEGGDEGYHALFGGGRFESFADHPRTLVKTSGYASTAAGRYQILARTWDDVRDKIGAVDFSPYWQDVAAVYLIRRRGALDDVLAGRFNDAIAKVAKEWASLPGAGYGQPERALETARNVYANAGGSFA